MAQGKAFDSGLLNGLKGESEEFKPLQLERKGSLLHKLRLTQRKTSLKEESIMYRIVTAGEDG